MLKPLSKYVHNLKTAICKQCTYLFVEMVAVLMSLHTLYSTPVQRDEHAHTVMAEAAGGRHTENVQRK